MLPPLSWLSPHTPLVLGAAASLLKAPMPFLHIQTHREKRSEHISALKKAVSSEHTSEQMQCLQNFSPFTCFTLAIDIFISKEVVAIVTRYFIPLVHISERLYVSIRSTCRHKLRGEGGEGRSREW